jgi:hypothetical protein
VGQRLRAEPGQAGELSKKIDSAERKFCLDKLSEFVVRLCELEGKALLLEYEIECLRDAIKTLGAELGFVGQ